MPSRTLWIRLFMLLAFPVLSPLFLFPPLVLERVASPCAASTSSVLRKFKSCFAAELVSKSRKLSRKLSTLVFKSLICEIKICTWACVSGVLILYIPYIKTTRRKSRLVFFLHECKTSMGNAVSLEDDQQQQQQQLVPEDEEEWNELPLQPVPAPGRKRVRAKTKRVRKRLGAAATAVNRPRLRKRAVESAAFVDSVV